MSQPIDTASVEIVPDFSNFARETKAGIDKALRGIVADVRAAFGQVERAAAEAGREVGQDFQRGGERAETALREVATTSTIAMGRVSASAGAAGLAVSGRLTAAATVAKTALLGLAVAAGAGLAAMAGFGLKAAASLEQTQIGLEALLGSAQSAKTFMGELQQFASATPFAFEGVADASRRILAFGTSVGIARDEVIPTLTTIGNLVSVLGQSQESIDSVVRAFGQMASKGRVSQEELLQLGDALPGFNVNAAIAAATGLSVADSLELITAGGVDATTGINALLQGMAQFQGAAGAMEKQSQTLLGVFSTFKDTLSFALADAFTPVIPEIKSALSGLTPVLESAMGDIAPALGGALTSLLKLAGPLVKGLAAAFGPLLVALGPAIDALAPSLEPLGEAFGQIFTALAPILPLLGEFLNAALLIAVPILQLLALVLKPLTPILQFLADSVALFGSELAKIDWAAVGQAIGGFFVDAWNKVKEFFSFIGRAFVEFPDNVQIVFELVRGIIVGKILEVIAFVQALPGRILDAIGNFGSLLLQKGKDLIVGLWDGIKSMGGWLWGKIKSFVADNILGPVGQFLGIHSPSKVFAEQVGRPIAQGIGVGMLAEVGSLRGMLDGVIGDIVPAAGGGNSSPAGAVFHINLGGVHFAANPTEGEARRTGQLVGASISAELQRRAIGLAVRTT
jgi:tape measure domain-containing protein